MKKYIFTLVLLIMGLIEIFPQQNISDKQNIQVLLEKGIKHHDAREYKEAIENYKEILKIDPKSIIATYEIALSYLSLRDFKKAVEYSTKVINSKDKDLHVGAYGVKSESLVELGKVDDAITLLEKALKRYSNDYYLHFNLALNFFNKGDLDNTINHVDSALSINKSQSGAYLLSAYALNDKHTWVQSILSFQIFLLMEPDSHRSKNAFEEMLQVMQVKKATAEPVERSFIQKQLQRQINQNDSSTSIKTPPLSRLNDVDRELMYRSIENTKDSLNKIFQDSTNVNPLDSNLYITFKEVTRTIFTVLSQENDGTKIGSIWNFHVPIATKILNSPYFDSYCRYISVAYFPESLEWWENNQESAAKFVRWFEKGDENE
ncbi:MAG: tetratricopeptide repeat protein [Candidatus Saccharimonadaceae bacterium]